MAHELVTMSAMLDEKICSDEIREMKIIKGKKDTLILSAADKLARSGKYDSDLSVISSKIHKLWPELSPSYIRETLPKQYKRSYTKQTDSETPEDLLEEFIAVTEDLCKELADIAGDIFKKIRKSPEIKAQIQTKFAENDDISDITEELELMIISLQEIKKIPDKQTRIEKFLGILKKMRVETQVTKEYTDYRQRTTTFQKIILKMIMTVYSFSDLADIMQYSSKWMSMLDKNEKLANIIAKSELCPSCGFSFAKWFEIAQRCKDENIPVPKPKQWTKEFSD